MIPLVDFRAIKTLVPIREALARVGWKSVWEKRSIVRGPCPLHASSRTDTRYFVAAGVEWYCWSCRKGGDVTRLWRLIHGHESDLAAALDLCRVLHVEVPRVAR